MKSVLNGIKYNIVYQILFIIAPLITSPYLSRVLGAERIGVYQYSYSIAYYFFLFSILGVNSYGNREISKCRESKEERSNTFWQIYYIQLFLSLIFSVIYIFSVSLFAKDDKIIFLLQVIQILSAILEINWYIFALEKFKEATLGRLIAKIITIIFIFAFVKSKNDMVKYTVISLFENILGLLILMPHIFKTTYFVKPNIKKIFEHLKPNFILFISIISSSTITLMDKILLGAFCNNIEVGYYNYARNIIWIPNALTNAVCATMLPRISNLIANNENEKGMKYFKNSLIYVTILNIALSFGMYSVAYTFIPWYLGKGYERTALLVQILSPTIIFNGFSSIIANQYLIPKGKDKEYTYSMIVGSIVSIILNIVFVKKYGAVGVSLAASITYGVLGIIHLYMCKDMIDIKDISLIVAFLFVGYLMSQLIYKFNSVISIGNNLAIVLIDVLIGAIFYLSICGIVYLICRLKKNKVKNK